MHESYTSLLDYEKVLSEVISQMPKLMNNEITENLLDIETRGNELMEERLLTVGNEIEISQIAGTILSIEKIRFKKLIFRATRGKALTFFYDFPFPQEDERGEMKYKCVYIVMFQEGK